MKTVLLVFAAVTIWVVGTSKVNAASCTAIASGDWYNPAIWSCSDAPGC